MAVGMACSDDEDTTSAQGALQGTGGTATRPASDACPGIALPEGQYFVAPGLCVSAVAVDQGSLRQIAFTSTGDLIGVRATGEIVRYRDVNHDGTYSGTDEVVAIANSGGNGNNAHLDEAGGYLYAGSPDGVVRFAYSATSNDLGNPEAVVTGQPSNGTHSYHTVHVYDGWLYVHSGSEDNAVAPALPAYDTNRSLLKRFRLSDLTGTPFAWADGEVFVTGLRNMVGFTSNAAGQLYGVVNGMDDLSYRGVDVHLDNPGEDLVELRQGEAHGYPYCFTGAHVLPGAGEPSDAGPTADAGLDAALATSVVPAGTQLASDTGTFVNPHDDAWCAANSVPPVTFLEAHSAPLDIAFNLPGTGGALPGEWTGGAFVTQHGSWDTEPSVGHRVLFIPFDASGNAPQPDAAQTATRFPFSVVFGGGTRNTPRNGSWGWNSGSAGEDPVRPVGVAVSPIDAALYVSSDNAGVLGTGTTPRLQGSIYRIARSTAAGK